LAVDLDEVVARIRHTPLDEQAWRVFFSRAYPHVLYYLYGFVRSNRETAQDLAQETFFRFLRYGGAFRVNTFEEALSFLRVTARNVFFSYLSEKATGELQLSGEDERTDTSKWSRMIELGLDIDRLSTLLQPAEMALLQLALEGRSLEEIADALGIAYSAAGTRLSRLRAKLRVMTPISSERSRP
jgi:RNA polymerase sigma factor (sigma-70 family)